MGVNEYAEERMGIIGCEGLAGMVSHRIGGGLYPSTGPVLMSWPSGELRFFTKTEFDHPDKMARDILLLIDRVRERSGCRIKITSDYRTQEEHELIYPDPARRPDSPHQRGTALDFKPVPFSVSNRLLVLEAITHLYREGKCPMLGLEIADRHFHIDLDTDLKRPWVWIGRSK